MRLRCCCLLLAHACAVSAQLYDFPSFAFSITDNRRLQPTDREMTAKRIDLLVGKEHEYTYDMNDRTTKKNDKNYSDHNEQRRNTGRAYTTVIPEVARETAPRRSNHFNISSFVDVPLSAERMKFFKTSQVQTLSSHDFDSTFDFNRNNKPNTDFLTRKKSTTEPQDLRYDNTEYNSDHRLVGNVRPKKQHSVSSNNDINVNVPHSNQISNDYFTTIPIISTNRPGRNRPDVSRTYLTTTPPSYGGRASRSDGEISYNYHTTKRLQRNNDFTTRRSFSDNGSSDRRRGDRDYTGRRQDSNDHTTKTPARNYEGTTERPANEEYFVNQHDSDRKPDFDTESRPWSGAQSPTVRPGVLRPDVDESRAPITNRPPGAGAGAAAGAFVFPDDEPEVILGPDVDFLSEEKKRKALQISERMCERYQAQSTQQVAAIPLVPSPSPATVSVARCTPINVPLVVGGQVVSIEQYPHMAAVGWDKIRGGGYSWKCGGSLVSERYVLTAAHCSYQDRDNTVVQGPPRVVQLGATQLDDAGARLVRVAAVVRHPGYSAPLSYHDIALVKLAEPVGFSDAIRPACIGEPPSAGEAIIATGWGRTEFGGSMSRELRGVSLPVWELADCARALGTSRKLPRGPSSESQICAGEPRGGKDTCQGDSGGPAQVGSSCAWRVVGVTSLGRACGAPRTPALYARAQRLFIAAVLWL